MRTLGNLLRNHTNNRNLFASLAISLDSLELPEVRPITEFVLSSLWRLLVLLLTVRQKTKQIVSKLLDETHRYQLAFGRLLWESCCCLCFPSNTSKSSYQLSELTFLFVLAKLNSAISTTILRDKSHSLQLSLLIQTTPTKLNLCQ